MAPRSSNDHRSWQEKYPASLHLGSLQTLLWFLHKHEVQEVCLNALVSPTYALRSEHVRHFGVCVSAYLSTEPGAPLLYGTFLAASVAWTGKRTRILHPYLESDDPLRTLPAQEAAERLQHSLFFTLQQVLQAPSRDIVVEAQWDVPDVWVGMAKGCIWREGAWHQQEQTTDRPGYTAPLG